MRTARCAAAVLAFHLAASGATADVVERRGGAPPLTGSITRVDDAGVTLATGRGDEVLVPWDRVRRVESERSAAGLDRWRQTSIDLWRARTRLERGDTALAESLFERLFYDQDQGYRGRSHATARLVAEGLARCYLAHGANDRAVIPVLETIRLERAGIGRDTYAGLEPIIDPETALCRQMPPVWVASRRLPRVEEDLRSFEAGDDPVVADLAALYRAALREQGGGAGAAAAPAAIELRAAEHPGVSFLALVVECHAPTAERREAARRRLADRLDTLEPWAEAWARFALGSSLVREPGVGRHQRGTVHLVHLPARFRSTQPFLSGLALDLSGAASRADGDAAAATVFEAELRRWYPNHPVLTAGAALAPHRPEEQP